MAVCIGNILYILCVAVNKEPTTVELSSDNSDEDHLDVDGAVLANMSLLLNGEELTCTFIIRYQLLLRDRFAIGGLEDPAYGKEYNFSTQRGRFVQILHVNCNHWITVSNINCRSGITVFCNYYMGLELVMSNT